MKILKTLRSEVLTALHNAWMLDPECEANVSNARVRCIMEVYGLKFKQPKDISPIYTLTDISDMAAMFFERINSPKYDDPAYFAIACEGFMDFEPITRKDNEMFVTMSKETHCPDTHLAFPNENELNKVFIELGKKAA